MTKILYLRSSSQVYGAECQILELAKGIRDREFCVSLMVMATSIKPNPLVVAANDLEIPVDQILVDSKFSYRFLKDLTKYINDRQIKIIHTHDYKSNAFGLLASRRTDASLVSTAHGFTESTLKLKFYKYIDAFALRRFDRVIAVSEKMRDDLIKLKVPEKKVTIIHNCIDLKQNQKEMAFGCTKKDLGLDDDQKVILAIGRLSAEKNFGLLLRAFSRILSDFPTTMLLLAGDGPDRHMLENISDELGITDSVTFLGYYKNAHTLIPMSDCIAISSIREGLPIVLLEAMAAGQTVVATAVGGIPEVITDGANGILVEPDNVSSMAKGLKSVLSGAIDQKKLAAAAIRKIETSFTPEKMLEETTTVYRDLVKADQKS